MHIVAFAAVFFPIQNKLRSSLIIRLRTAAVDRNRFAQIRRLRLDDCSKEILNTRQKFPCIVINCTAVWPRIGRNAVCIQPQRSRDINRTVKVIFLRDDDYLLRLEDIPRGTSSHK